MHYLKMYIGNILLDKHPLDYEGCETVMDRIQEQHNKAEKMYYLHYEQVMWRIKEPPVFFIETDSKMNERTFEPSPEVIYYDEDQKKFTLALSIPPKTTPC